MGWQQHQMDHMPPFHCRNPGRGFGASGMASAVARAYNGGLGAEPPAGSRGRAPGQGVRVAHTLKLKTF